MMRQHVSLTVCLLLGVALFGLGEVRAQSMAEYTASPPFIDENVKPNLLLLVDNSGSMNEMAFPNAFDTTALYTGIFEPTECYQYASGQFAPNPAANPATPGLCNSAPYSWSGNLLNYVSMRRLDVIKWALIGGKCAVTRNTDNSCPSVKGEDGGFPSIACCRDQTRTIPVTALSNRMPATLIPGAGDAFFHLMGSDATLKGNFCVSNSSTLPAAGVCDDWSTGVELHKIQAVQNTASNGVIQLIGDRARLGLMRFDTSATNDGGVVLNEVGASISSLISTVEGLESESNTMLAESLYEATRYFAQLTPAYAASDYSLASADHDPFYFLAPQWAGTSQHVPCCTSNILVLTDGAPVDDTNIPTNLQSFASPLHTPCSFTVAECTGLTNWFMDDVAYYAHTTDLRNGTVSNSNSESTTFSLGTGKDLSGTQNLHIYTFATFVSSAGFEDIRRLLSETAKYGSFTDSNGNNEPDLVSEWDTLNNNTGALGADGLPDGYFEASDAEDVKAKLMSALFSILNKSGAGSSLSMLTSSSNGEGALYQSFFFPRTLEGLTEVTWTGFSQSLFLDSFGNLREDDGDAKLVYQDDPILRMRLLTGTEQVVVDRFVDTNEDGQPDTPSTPLSTVLLEDVNSLWEAGEQLALTASSSRKLLTWLDTDDDGDVDSGEQITFSTAKLAELTPYLQPSAAPFTATNLINFIRGDHITGLRDRRLTVGGSLKVWKLGDAIHAPPVVVGAPAQRFDVIYGDSSYTAFFAKYKDRRQVAYVGANDGMLHAFNAGYYHRGDDPSTVNTTEHGWFTRTPTNNSGGPQLGDELWGFIPQELLPHLRWLADPNYTHVYYVDLKPKVTDARIFTPDADHPNGWGTILMGGFRLGGSCGNCTSGTGATPMTVSGDFDNAAGTPDTTRTFYSAYFVLDITNPEKDPILLHSFSSADLGLTTTVPSMLRVSPNADGVIDNTNAKWFMVMGSGPVGYHGGSTQAGNLYALDLASTVTSVTTLVGETGNAIMGTPLSIDRDLDYRVDVAYMGSMVDDGSLPWEGKLHRLTMHDCLVTPCSTNIWGVSVGTNRGASEILTTFDTKTLGPVMASPAVALDDSNQLWIFSGTGRYVNAIDKTNTETQYFVGVKDSVLNGQCTESNQTNCQDGDLLDVTGAVVCVLGVGTCGSSTDQVTGISGVTNFPDMITKVAAKDGWYISLTNGERALARPLVFAGIVFFPTFTPTNDACASTGNSSLYALYYRTGTAYSTPIIGTTPSGSNKLVNKKVDQGPGLTTETGVHIGQGSEEGQAQVCSQNSQGEIGCTKVQMATKFVSRFLTWHEPRN